MSGRLNNLFLNRGSSIVDMDNVWASSAFSYRFFKLLKIALASSWPSEFEQFSAGAFA